MPDQPKNFKPLEVGAGHRYFGLDLIRALAIMLVLLSHTFPGGHTWNSVRVLKYLFGYFGVEMFFILSGYLIGGILIKTLMDDRLNSFKDVLSFWKRRWFRTLPNYYLFLVLALLLARCAEGHFPGVAKNYFWFGQALVTEHPDFFTISWSLAVEEWFYILFPLVLLLLSHGVLNRRRATVICIIAFLAWPALLRWLLPPCQWDPGVRRATLPRLDAITYGVALAFVRDFRIQTWKILAKCWPIGLAATAVLGLLLGQWLNHGEASHLFFFRVLIFCCTSLGLALWFPKAAEMKAEKSITTKIIRSVSLWSYSIYLSHAFFGDLSVTIFHHFGWSIFKSNAVIISCFVWMTSLPTSALLYRFYEKPMMDLRERPLKSIFHRPRSQTK